MGADAEFLRLILSLCFSHIYVELCQEQPDCKLGKEYFKAVYCHPAYLASMQSTSGETLGWRKQKLE